MRVTCDKCGKSFIVSMKKDKVSLSGKSVERTYYVCPFCRADYLVFLKDDDIDCLLEKLERLKRIKPGIPFRQENIDKITKKIKSKERRLIKGWKAKRKKM